MRRNSALLQLCSYLGAISIVTSLSQHSPVPVSNEVSYWHSERPDDMAVVKNLEVMCGKKHMEVSVEFDRPFNGIIFSKGAINEINCVYVKANSGSTSYKFEIMYDKCSTRPDTNGQFYENNIVLQYDKDLIEVWDEAKRLRCEWFNDYEKGVTKPPIHVSELDVIELNFRGDDIDCWMEIQQGKGPWANPVTGIVRLGTTLTMVVGINDVKGEFDMRVKSCEASDNLNKPIQLTDENGCVLRKKMISKFMKMQSNDGKATVVTYAFFHAFKFPDSLAVNIRCKVEICRYGCPDHCEPIGPNILDNNARLFSNSVTQSEISGAKQKKLENNFIKYFNNDGKYNQNRLKKIGRPLKRYVRQPNTEKLDGNDFPETDRASTADDFINSVFNGRSLSDVHDSTLSASTTKSPTFLSLLPNLDIFSLFGDSNNKAERTDRRHDASIFDIWTSKIGPKEDKTPIAPIPAVPVHRTASSFHGEPLIYPSKIESIAKPVKPIESFVRDGSKFPYGPRSLSFHKISRTRRNAEIDMVNSGYEVVSTADFDFIPDEEQTETLQLLKGKPLFSEGICLPVYLFALLFIIVTALTIISIMITTFVCYHRHLQKVECLPIARPPNNVFQIKKPNFELGHHR